MPHEKVRALRKRLSERRARQKSKRLQRKRRVRKAKQAAQAKVKQARDRAGESRSAQAARGAKQEADATTQEAGLLASELGIDPSHVRAVIESAQDTISEHGSQLDVDGDGDTDLLNGLDPVQSGGQQSQRADDGVVDPSEPVMGGEDSMAVPELNDFDVEEPVERKMELDVEQPLGAESER